MPYHLATPQHSGSSGRIRTHISEQTSVSYQEAISGLTALYLDDARTLVRQDGIEPPTQGTSNPSSTTELLSHLLVYRVGIEPTS
jgi:hypothetical protein